MPTQPHGQNYSAAGNFSPDAVAASMQRGDGGFGRAQETYFDHPILRKAHWGSDIVQYLFVGGAAAASAALASLAGVAATPATRSWCATAATPRSPARSSAARCW